MNKRTKKFAVSYIYTLIWTTTQFTLIMWCLQAWSYQSQGGPLPDSIIWRSGFAGLMFALGAMSVPYIAYEFGVRLGIYRRLGWGRKLGDRLTTGKPKRGGSH